MIERIQIKGFKSIRELDLILRPLNILIGPNGVGKSNFISFFKLLNQLYEQRLRQYVADNGYMNALLFFGAKHTEQIAGLVDFDNTNVYEFHLGTNAVSEAILEEESDSFNGIDDQRKDYGQWHVNYWTVAGRESTLKESHGYRAQHLKRFLQSFKIYHFHDTSRNAPIKQPSRVEDVHRLYEDGRNLAAFLYFLQEHHAAHFRRIVQAVRSVAPFFQNFNLHPSPGKQQTIQLVWQSADDSEQNFFADQLSDGTLRFIALATLLLQPSPPPTILIDEPELGLHPVAIAKLAALLQKAGTQSQLIVSTQSVELLNYFEPEDVVVVERERATPTTQQRSGPTPPRQSVFRRLNRPDLARWLEKYSLGEIWQKNVVGGRP